MMESDSHAHPPATPTRPCSHLLSLDTTPKTQRNLKHNIKPNQFKATEVRAQCTSHPPSTVPRAPFQSLKLWEEFENHCSWGRRNSNYRPR